MRAPWPRSLVWLVTSIILIAGGPPDHLVLYDLGVFGLITAAVAWLVFGLRVAWARR